MKMLLLALPLLLAGCITNEEMAYLSANYPTRPEVEATNAAAACKALARNLVQIARCEVRR